MPTVELLTAAHRAQILNSTDLVPEEQDGFTHPLGWAKVVIDLHDKIVEKYPNYNLYQAKSDRGTLLFRCSVEEELDVSDWIDDAVAKAYITCELCGVTEGKVRTNEYHGVLCDTHEQDMNGLTEEISELGI